MFISFGSIFNVQPNNGKLIFHVTFAGSEHGQNDCIVKVDDYPIKVKTDCRRKKLIVEVYQ